MIKHKVVQGECLHSIGSRYGFTPEKIWMDPSNNELRATRKDSQVLLPGDSICIPELEVEPAAGATDKRHRFRRKAVPAKIRVQIKQDGEARSNVPFRLEVNGKSISGSTDGEGVVEAPIDPQETSATLYLGREDDEEIFELVLGGIDPLETEQGGLGRLYDLGYDTSGSFDDVLKAFQADMGLPETGRYDKTTQDRIKKEFGE